MVEKINASESPKRSIAVSSNTPRDFQKIASKTKRIQTEEEKQALTEFLEQNKIPNTDDIRIRLKNLVIERQLFDSNFSVEDLTDEEILMLKDKEHKYAWQENKSEAQTSETLVDGWKSKGFSNYETLQKLLNAHEVGQITMLSEKYENFKKFFGLLQNDTLGADTPQIVEIINRSEVDPSSPRAFDVIIFNIFEDESISETTKEKLSKQFKLFPIRNGDDLKENLYIKQNQIKQRKSELQVVSESLESLETEKEATTEQLAKLKQAILTEKDSEKRYKLEKEYDELEEELERIEKETKEQELKQHQLKDRPISDEIIVRGARARLIKDEIVVTIPESNTKVTIPASLENENIGKAVNAYLVNELFKKFGLESYFFYQSDFADGGFPYPPNLASNDLLLFRLGFSNDGQILKNSEIRDFEKRLLLLMKPEENRVDLTLQENAAERLGNLNLLTNKELDQEHFAKKLKKIKRFEEPNI